MLAQQLLIGRQTQRVFDFRGTNESRYRNNYHGLFGIGNLERKRFTFQKIY